MYKLCIAILMCCACFPPGSAAPKSWGADPRSEPESNAEQNDMLQEEVDGQESILSKVGGKVTFLYFSVLCFIVISSLCA